MCERQAAAIWTPNTRGCVSTKQLDRLDLPVTPEHLWQASRRQDPKPEFGQLSFELLSVAARRCVRQIEVHVQP